MNWVADESVERPIVERLRREGHAVWYVAEMDPSITDNEVLRHANEQNAMLITADKDFGELVFQKGLSSNGVLLLRLAGLSNETKAQIVSRIVNQHGAELRLNFSVAAAGVLRIRKKIS
jgi:predicted nuclease of predicted toxin-antitoxin system